MALIPVALIPVALIPNTHPRIYTDTPDAYTSICRAPTAAAAAVADTDNTANTLAYSLLRNSTAGAVLALSGPPRHMLTTQRPSTIPWPSHSLPHRFDRPRRNKTKSQSRLHRPAIPFSKTKCQHQSHKHLFPITLADTSMRSQSGSNIVPDALMDNTTLGASKASCATVATPARKTVPMKSISPHRRAQR